MKLSSMFRPMNRYFCQYGNRRDMAELCSYVWSSYLYTLRTGKPPCDVMIWEVGPTIRVRPASTGLDETNKKYVRPFPIYFELKGFAAKHRKIERQKDVKSSDITRQLKELDEEMRDLMKAAILKGFQARFVSKFWQDFDQDPLTVVMTAKDEGLRDSQFELVWKNDSGPTINVIKKRAKANVGKPLPTADRNPSKDEVHRMALREEKKKRRMVVKEYLAARDEKVKKRKPAISETIRIAIAESEQQRLKLLKNTDEKKTVKTPDFFLSLDDHNQFKRLVASQVSLEQITELVAKYPWTEFDEYDNRKYEYWGLLMNPALVNGGFKSIDSVWKKLNRAQKVFYVMTSFEGEVDNGGVWQFIFNRPQLVLAAREAMTELGETELAKDYDAVLAELLGKSKAISEIRQRADKYKLNDEERWRAFVEGYGHLTSTKKIEKYFHSAAYKKKHCRRISDYIESRLSHFAEIQD